MDSNPCIVTFCVTLGTSLDLSVLLILVCKGLSRMGEKPAHMGPYGVKASASNAGDLGSIPGLGRSPGGEHGNPLQYFGLLAPHPRLSFHLFFLSRVSLCEGLLCLVLASCIFLVRDVMALSPVNVPIPPYASWNIVSCAHGRV